MVHCSKVRQNITSYFNEVEIAIADERVKDVVWGSWKHDEPPHVCGVCRPELEDYLVPVTFSDVIGKWKETICFSCGWVPRFDPNREKRIHPGVLFHKLPRPS